MCLTPTRAKRMRRSESSESSSRSMEAFYQNSMSASHISWSPSTTHLPQSTSFKETCSKLDGLLIQSSRVNSWINRNILRMKTRVNSAKDLGLESIMLGTLSQRQSRSSKSLSKIKLSLKVHVSG